MTPIDLLTMIMLALGLFLVIVLSILNKRGKLKSETWPRVFGLGAGAYGFVSLMTASILLRPVSKVVEYTMTNFLLSLAIGITTYFSAQIIVRRTKK